MSLLYERLGVTPDPVQRAALKDNRYDTAISLLEDRHVGGRGAVRRVLAAILTPAEVSHEATRTHEALLTLSQRRDGKLRGAAGTLLQALHLRPGINAGAS